MQYAWENKNESIFPISFFDALDAQDEGASKIKVVNKREIGLIWWIKKKYFF